MSEIKRIDIKEFQEFGYLQELNRQFLHPLGMALEVIIDEKDESVKLGGIWDYREDPEGMTFQDMSKDTHRKKAENVKSLQLAAAKTRLKLLGFEIQPVGHKYND